MRVLLWVALLVQPPGNNRVGIIWDPQAKAQEGLRQRVRRAVADTPGVTLVDDALTAARWAIAHEVPRTAAQTFAKHQNALAAAAAHFRGGDLKQAASVVAAMKGRVLAHAEIPGSARLLWEAEILRARIASARSDSAETNEALLAALALDPDAVLSTRVVPPELVAQYDALQRGLVASRPSWSVPQTSSSAATIQYEIDGQPGLRPVPPGDHVIVARRPGRAPVATVQASDQLWGVPDSEEVLPATLPLRSESAAEVCRAIALDAFVLLRVDGERIGFQRHDCGEGFGEISVATTGDIEAKIRTGLLEARVARVASSRLADSQAWPQEAEITPVKGPSGTDRGAGTTESVRPWYRRAWFWGLVGGIVAASVAVGVGLGTADQGTRIIIDTKSFTETESNR